MNRTTNQRRAELFFLAEYYGWAARKASTPTGNNPLTGQPWPKYEKWVRDIDRAQSIAAAKVVYAMARAYGPVPLP